MVSGRSDPPEDFIVPLDDPNEEITEQWQDGLQDWYICRDDQCSVKPTRISCDVSQRRSSHFFCPCLKRRTGSVSTDSEITAPRERVSLSPSRDPGVVLPQKAMICCMVPTLSPCTSRVWIAVTTQSGLSGQDPHSRNLNECFRRGWAKLQRRQG